jgi:uncharacterized protein YggE
MSQRPRRPIRRRSLVPAAAASIVALCAVGAPGAAAFSQPASTPAAAPSSPAIVIPVPVPTPPLPAPTGPSSQSTLSITGSGSVEIPPDEATISIEVRSTAATATGARSKANARTDAVLAAITRVGVDRGSIQTSGISLSRGEVAATRHHAAHKVYSASNDLTVDTTKVSLVGPIVDAATAAGADSIDGPDFSFGDPSAGQAAATRAALADATSRAGDAAAALGYKVVGVQSVAINPDNGVTPEPVAGVEAAAAPSALARPLPTPVDPGQQEVDATVDVVFLIAPAASS